MHDIIHAAPSFKNFIIQEKDKIKKQEKSKRDEIKPLRKMIMDKVGDMGSAYAEFALYNWNIAPWELYFDEPEFPRGKKYMPRGSGCKGIINIGEPSKERISISTMPGGLFYQVHVFSDDTEKIKKVRFNFDTKLAEEYPEGFFKRRALIKIGDNWSLEDWTQKRYREFCRENEDENVKAVVLVYSNGDLRKDKIDSYVVDTEGGCSIEAEGYTKVTIKSETAAKTVEQELYCKEKVMYCPECDSDTLTFIIAERECTYSSSDTSTLGGITNSITGSGSISETYAADDRVIRMVLDKDRAKILHFRMYPPTKAKHWVTYTTSNPFTSEKSTGPPHIDKGDLEFVSGSKQYVTPAGVTINQTCVINENIIKGQMTMKKGSAVEKIEFVYTLEN